MTIIPVGTYILEFVYPGQIRQYYPGTWNVGQATTMTFNGGVDLVVTDAVLAHGSVAGRVTDQAGAGVATGVRLHGPDGAVRGEVRSAADGSYAFPVVPPGRYTVSFASPVSFPYLYQWSRQQRRAEDARVYAVTAGQQLTVNERLIPTGTVEGSYTAHGVGVYGVVVTLIPVSPPGMPVSRTTYTEGTFRFHAFPGTYLVRFDLPDGRTEWWPQAVSQAEARQVRVTAGGTVTLAAVPARTGILTGQLLATDGTPMYYAEVEVAGTAGGPPVLIRTDQAGRWFANMPAGSYTVRFRGQNQVQWANGKVSPETANLFPVRVNRTTTVDQRMLPTGRVRVIVDGGTREGDFSLVAEISGVTVTQRFVDPGGPSAVEFPVGPGTYRITVTGGDGTIGIIDGVTVRSGQTTEREVTLGAPES
jgi:hypothetical protein